MFPLNNATNLGGIVKEQIRNMHDMHIVTINFSVSCR